MTDQQEQDGLPDQGQNGPTLPADRRELPEVTCTGGLNLRAPSGGAS